MWDCDQVQHILHLVRVNELVFIQEMDHKRWIHSFINRMDACVVFATLWWVWKGRNHEVLNGILMLDDRILWSITHDVDAFKNGFDLVSGINREPHWVHWIWLRDDFVKVNIDGCSRGNPRSASMGSLIRRDDGQWLVGFIGFLGVTGNLFC